MVQRGGSNEYPQSMFWNKNKKNMYAPTYPSFAIYKWDIRRYILHRHVILMYNSFIFPGKFEFEVNLSDLILFSLVVCLNKFNEIQ